MAQFVPAMDLRAPLSSTIPPPVNLAAEQGLLGALLYDNSVFDLLPPELAAKHFFEPFHGRLFRSLARSHQIGLAVDAVALGEEFRADTAYKELGGVGYLGDLIDRSPLALNAPGYAAAILDLAIRRELMRLAADIAHRASAQFEDEDGAKVDARALADALQRDLTAIQLQSTRDDLVSLYDAAVGAAAFLTSTTSVAAISTGLAPLDLALGSLQPGDLILLGGRPGMGKSAVAGAFSLGVGAPEIAAQLCGVPYDGREAMGVLEIHGEMTFGSAEDGGQQSRRHLSNLGFAIHGSNFPNYKLLRERKVSPGQAEAAAEVAKLFARTPIRGLKRTGLRISALRAIARRQFAAWEREGIKPGLIVIDHVGLMRADGRVSGRYESQTEIAIGLKELADELGVPILALIQLSREIERRDDKRPQLSDLRDSGAWEENADAVIFVYREAYYAKHEKEPNPITESMKWSTWDAAVKSPFVELIIGKLREGESGKTAKVWADLPHNAIRGFDPKEGLF